MRRLMEHKVRKVVEEMEHHWKVRKNEVRDERGTTRADDPDKTRPQSPTRARPTQDPHIAGRAYHGIAA